MLTALSVDVPTLHAGYLVFGQSTDVRTDIVSWNAHATRFFGTRIGLTSDERRGDDPSLLSSDPIVFVVAPHDEAPGLRSTFARPRDPEDLSLAEAADARAGGTGLALVARRCGVVWLVVREALPDRLALRLAAILASVLLGPILDASAGELFGVKTARAKLESAAPQTTKS